MTQLRTVLESIIYSALINEAPDGKVIRKCDVRGIVSKVIGCPLDGRTIDYWQHRGQITSPLAKRLSRHSVYNKKTLFKEIAAILVAKIR